ncbi:hypothetical protein L6V77_34585, partial [Myxococcota bacterium]|nr:hypothetical protein [Myxococcota bacterium]
GTLRANRDLGHRLVAVDEDGRVAWSRDVGATLSTGVFIAGDRIVWPTWHGDYPEMELYITVLDRDGLVRLPRTSLGIRSTGGLDLTPIVTDENGTALYVVKGSSYLPGAVGVWRLYLDLDTGAVLREQELNPGRGDLENVIDGPGVTLVSNSGGVRSVYDDAGRMVGNKIFFGQGPNPFGMLVGRTFGTVFLLPWGGVNAERITFDGRRSDTTFWFDHSPEPDIPGGADGLSTWIHSSGGCVTPRGRYIGDLGSNTLEVPGRDGPFRRIYVTGCGE